MATTTILDFGLPANSHSGANQNRLPGDYSCLEQGVYATSVGSNSLGAYRYDPDASDPSLPESNPDSPRYEPPHLRHRPGDTWIIDRDRPHDLLDPGPFGSEGWLPDSRTGRHRRGELPDPPRETEDDQPRSDRAHRPSPGPTSEGAERRRPFPGRDGIEPPEPPERRRRRFWEDDHEDRYDFGKLREDAWTRFLAGSQELHHAHMIASTTFADRWMDFWVTMRALLFRVLGIGSAADLPPVEGPTMPLRIVPLVQSNLRPSMGGTPFQGVRRTNPISPYLGNWERHFDERQAFREAVAI
ncbi:hypothetical protein [Glycomyces algeriensis]|uniref:Uncharacterized protein n=1 Tax=Glycomyces algeriensis TaxID=256037 RepID=A0A9W6LFP1_9ACTN|nr:hypothetical protein [Glycomyces algeriensis]MDA1367516.1 hypothetical protein [Glycomyces algeriensis]MDR7353121.1 hypothetical protein [Glycomyces algeriensis]GLI40814.1 hypothetical protein GALLR39Z86_06640 [Glycomyces algeriensis]